MGRRGAVGPWASHLPSVAHLDDKGAGLESGPWVNSQGLLPLYTPALYFGSLWVKCTQTPDLRWSVAFSEANEWRTNAFVTGLQGCTSQVQSHGVRKRH